MTQLVTQEMKQALWLVGAAAKEQAERAADEIKDTLNTCNSPALARQAFVLAYRLQQQTEVEEFAQFYAKAQLVAELHTGDIWREHPSSPATFNELMQSVGCSISEASDMLAWMNVIFPYFKDTMGLTEHQVWLTLGKAKIRRMTPMLRGLITGDSTSNRVRAAMDNLKQLVAKDTDGEQQNVIKAAVEMFYEKAPEMTSDELEKPFMLNYRTPPLDFAATRHTKLIIDEEGTILDKNILYQMVVIATEDQLVMLRRMLRQHMTFVIQEGPVIREKANGRSC